MDGRHEGRIRKRGLRGGDLAWRNTDWDGVGATAAEIENANRKPFFPTLRRVSAMLGRQAAEFVRRHHYEGLGRAELIMHSQKPNYGHGGCNDEGSQ